MTSTFNVHDPDVETDASQLGAACTGDTQPIQQNVDVQDREVRDGDNLTDGGNERSVTIINIHAANVTLGGSQTVVKVKPPWDNEARTQNVTPNQTTVSGGGINAKDKMGRTLLFHACKNTQVKMVKHLLDRGVDLDADAVEAACERGNMDIVKSLFPKSPRADKNADLQHYPYQTGSQKVTDDLKTVFGCGGTALHLACKHGQMEVIRYLLYVGASVDTPAGERGKSPLHVACTFNKVKVVELLLQHGAIIDRQDDEGCSPLHIALMTSSKDCVSILMKAGADVSSPDKSGMTPLHKALHNPSLYIRYDSQFFSGLWLPDKIICESLIQHGANVNKQDLEGNTPLHVLCRVESGTMTDNWPSPPYRAFRHEDVYRSLVTLLFDHGADVNIRNNRGEKALHGWIQTLTKGNYV